MNKRNIRYILVFLCILCGCLIWKTVSEHNKDTLAEQFVQVPDSQRMAVYWYWVSGNISAEGVKKDLDAMKRAGITRAYIGDIREDNVKNGGVKTFSDEWWEVLHAALKHASELDIEIGLFNSPGWSQSGGPWITPGQSMRYLASSESQVTGNGTVQELKLPETSEKAQDVRVIAYPARQRYSITENVQKEPETELVKDFHLDHKMTLRSVSFDPRWYLLVDVEIQAKVDGTYQTLKTARLDRTNGSPNVGFHPMAPICLSIPDTETQDVRICFRGGGQKTDVDVTLSDEPRMERYEEKSLGKMFQSPLPMWGEYMWETQPEPGDMSSITKADEIIDLTDKVDTDGILRWNVPDGDWTILRTAMMTTGVTNTPALPEATGLEVDKMSREHVAYHFDSYIGEVLRRIPEEDRKSLKVVVQDSYETGGQNWTDDMIESFKTRFGYDPVPYIPVLYGHVIDSQDQSERFLWDLRRHVADRVAYDYVGGLRDLCNKHGLTTWLECYGHWGFPSEFLMYGGQSDEVGGEFWSEGSLGDIENRAASSCAHIYGKQKVWAESCTSGGPAFSRYPRLLRSRTDRFFCEGINATLLHLYISQPDDITFPGVSAWFGNEFNRKNLWFEHMDLFTDYLRRCNLMLQQGRCVSEVAYFIGEDAPKMTGECNPALPKGYNFDYINAEVLHKASVRNGLLTLESGMQYHVLVLPKQTTMRPEVLKKIASLVQDGMCVVGPKPVSSPSMQNYPAADKEIQDLATKLWSAGTYGKGRVYKDGTELATIFKDLNLQPDCCADLSYISYTHRTADGGDKDIYFISNQSDKPHDDNATFRMCGRVPELWDPVTGEQRTLPEYREQDGQTIVPIHLEPNQSYFIVFDAKSRPNTAETKNFPHEEVLKQLDDAWTVNFQPEMRGPEQPQTFGTLTDWSLNENPQIKYYSGRATYTRTFDMNEIPEGRIYMDLGEVMVTARVYVNDTYAGGTWTLPYRVNITEMLHEGKNTVRVEVINNWQNRLIGDAKLPENERKTYCTSNPWNADSPLQASGLLGPVRILHSPTFH